MVMLAIYGSDLGSVTNQVSKKCAKILKKITSDIILNISKISQKTSDFDLQKHNCKVHVYQPNQTTLFYSYIFYQ